MLNNVVRDAPKTGAAIYNQNAPIKMFQLYSVIQCNFFRMHTDRLDSEIQV